MLLALDVGNTHTTIGVFREGEILRRWRLSTARERTVDEIGILLRQLCEWAEISPRRHQRRDRRLGGAAPRRLAARRR